MTFKTRIRFLLCALGALLVAAGAVPSISSAEAERVTISWDTDADIDLHVFDAAGNHAYFGDRSAIPTGELSTDVIPEEYDDSRHEEFYFDSSNVERLAFCIYNFHEYGGAGASTSVQYAITNPDGSNRSGSVVVTYGNPGVWIGASPVRSILRPPVKECGDEGAELKYVALGDSYSSGEAAGNYYGEPKRCHRSPGAWANLAANASPRVALAANLACSGAKTGDLTGQVNELPADTEIATVTVGGNDLGFSDVLAKCYVGNCVKKLKQAKRTIKRLEPTLRARYTQIQDKMPHGQLVVIGYPRLFPKGRERCLWLNKKEQKGANEVSAALDAATGRAAAATGARFVSVAESLNGHELCTGKSWIKSIGGTHGTSQTQGHPLPNGQQAIAGFVVPALN